MAPIPEMIGYDGEYDKNGLRHGQGSFQYANGDHYEGNWKENLYHGEGRLVLENGDLYQGKWKKGLLDGKHSHIKYYNGVEFIGVMKAGVKIGACKYVYDHGEKVDEGWWLKSGRYVGKTWSRRCHAYWCDWCFPNGFPVISDLLNQLKIDTILWWNERQKRIAAERKRKEEKRAQRKAAREAKEKAEAEKALQRKEAGLFGTPTKTTPNGSPSKITTPNTAGTAGTAGSSTTPIKSPSAGTTGAITPIKE